uniref:Uncharacterized protein n=1 Tax=Manihot esculenta TaxID=3983 RepID=A0A2C9W583_MANES
MASMSEGNALAKELYARITMEEEHDCIQIDEGGEEADEEVLAANLLCMVVRVMDDRQVKFRVFINTMGAIWRPVKGTYIHSDRRNFSLLWLEYMRIRISINVLKP